MTTDMTQAGYFESFEDYEEAIYPKAAEELKYDASPEEFGKSLAKVMVGTFEKTLKEFFNKKRDAKQKDDCVPA